MVTAAGGAIINTASVAGVIADPYGAVRRRQARCAWTDEGGRAGYACRGHRAEFHHRWGAGRSSSDLRDAAASPRFCGLVLGDMECVLLAAGGRRRGSSPGKPGRRE
jgi:hypothetical protein